MLMIICYLKTSINPFIKLKFNFIYNLEIIKFELSCDMDSQEILLYNVGHLLTVKIPSQWQFVAIIRD